MGLHRILTRQRKLRLIDKLVYRARHGSTISLNALIALFDPLLLKISNRIHYRINGRVSVDELHEAGIQEFRKSVLIDYDPHGKAHFNHYVEVHVHAELWKLFRQMAKETPTTYEDLEFMAQTVGDVVEDSNAESITRYAMINLNQSEKRVIDDCVLKGISCVEEAKILKLSKVRVSQIKNAALRKLKKIAIQHGLSREDTKS